MTDLMNLATDYAQACYHLDPHSYDPKYTAEARAALQSAIEALQAENERLELALEKACRKSEELQSRLDAMGKGEAVGFVAPHDLKTLREGYPATVVMLPSNKRTEPLYAAPRFTECRIELVGAIHTLASHYENRLGRLDPEDRKLAKGDIAHAMATADKWNWNGNGIGGTP